MNRRNFLSTLGLGTVGAAAVAHGSEQALDDLDLRGIWTQKPYRSGDVITLRDGPCDSERGDHGTPVYYRLRAHVETHPEFGHRWTVRRAILTDADMAFLRRNRQRHRDKRRIA
jgi:hypothetical protein